MGRAPKSNYTRHLEKGIATSKIPNPPSFLTKEAKEIWKRLSKDMKANHLIESIDVDSFAVICNSIAEWRKATVYLNEHGCRREVFDELGNFTKFVKDPMTEYQRTHADIITRLGGQFGLTPNARAKLFVVAKDSERDDAMANLLDEE